VFTSDSDKLPYVYDCSHATFTRALHWIRAGSSMASGTSIWGWVYCPVGSDCWGVYLRVSQQQPFCQGLCFQIL